MWIILNSRFFFFPFSFFFFVSVSSSLSQGGLKFVRARDVDGAGWNAPVFVTTGLGIQHVSLVDAGGFPAISYYNSITGRLMYVRANDATGSMWGNPVVVDPNVEKRGLYAKMVLNSNFVPHIAYVSQATRTIKLASATNTTGIEWTVTDGPSGSAIYDVDLTFVTGSNVPLILYSQASDSEKSVYMSTATTVGATVWNTPLLAGNVTLSGAVSITKVANVPTMMWNDIVRGWVYMRQTTDSSAVSLDNNVYLVDKGAWGQ
jgi:hypothetical protein